MLSAPFVTVNLKQIYTFVTDFKPMKKIIKICKDNDVELIIIKKIND